MLSSPSTRSGCNKKRCQKRVSFVSVQTRIYEQILEVHPSTSSGPSIGLGWSYTETTPQKIPEDPRDFATVGMEASEESTVSSTNDIILTKRDRESILKSLGYTQKDINRAIRKNKKARDQRRETLNKMTVKALTESED